MQDLFRVLIQAARSLTGTVSRHSLTKHLLLVFMMVSLSRAVVWDTGATLNTVCDNSTMSVNVSFTNAFRGIVFQERNYFTPQCSYVVPVDQNVTEVELSLKYKLCDIKIQELQNVTIASTDIRIQMHVLLDSIYDRTVRVSCEIENFYPINETQDYNPYAAYGLESTWMEFKNGYQIFGEVGEPLESTLFMVMNVKDDGTNQDMMVQNCLAHTDNNLTETTTLVQMSNYYGCPDSSLILGNFTVVRPEGEPANMYAYAPLGNFSLIATGGRVSVSCGITICENACPNNCNDTESPIRLPFSDYAQNYVVARADGAIMPDSLRQLNRQNDRSRRTPNRPKRSIGSLFSSFFQWESRIVSEGNITNVTYTGVAKGHHLENAVLAKDVLVAANAQNVNLTHADSSFGENEFCIDWATLRFVFLMAGCLFITVMACYCYADANIKSRKGQSPFVF